MKSIKQFVMTGLLIALTPALNAEVIKSERDERLYSVIELDNRLKVALVSDERLQKAAAALSVAVGSNANPEGREGLAHFLEHMLFLGTEKFPEVGEYQSYISANGGSHNAFTAYDNTTYFFDIKTDSLEPALDRFSQFFISPLFDPDYVDRERNAVHSEFESKRLEDGRRSYVADKLIMNPEHSWSMFTVGNLDTLSNNANDPIQPDLINFYERYYSANLMTAAIIGPQSLAELEQLARTYFGPIKNSNAAKYQDTERLYDDARLPMQLEVKTLKAMQQLRISFPLPERRSHWQTKPLYFVANQLGYEGKGSLLSYLKQRGWAEGLGAWVGIDLEKESRFDISIDLTQAGQEHYKEVVEAVFAKLKLLQAKGLQPQLFDEQRQLAQTDFLFQQPSDPSSEATRLTQMLAQYPESELLRAPYYFGDFDAELVNGYLELMVPERMILTHYSDTAVTDQREGLYGIEYSRLSIDTDLLARWSNPGAIEQLSIKSLNPFVAQNFQPKSDSAESRTIPKQLLQTEGLDVWHLQDSQFKQPRAAINLAILTPEVQASAESVIASTLLTRMMRELQNETLYDAALAGLSADLYPHSRGLSLKVSGYDDRLSDLFTSQLNNLDVALDDQQIFERLKQSYREELLNNLKDKPYNRTFARLYQQLIGSWSTEDRLAVLDRVGLADLQAQRETLLASGELSLFIHGNINSEEAEQISHAVQAKFNSMRPISVARLEVAQLEGINEVSVNVDQTDSALLLYMQAQSEDYQQRAEVAIINEMLSAPFYTSLRTEQQLGYVVFSTYLPMDKQAGIGLVAQSPVADSAQLRKAFELFLTEWRQSLPEQLKSDLDNFKASVASRISTPSQRLSEETDRLWREIDRANAAFDTQQKMLDAVEKVDADALIKRIDQLMQRQLWIATQAKDA